MSEDRHKAGLRCRCWICTRCERKLRRPWMLRTYDRNLRNVVPIPDDLGEAHVRELGLAVPRE